MSSSGPPSVPPPAGPPGAQPPHPPRRTSSSGPPPTGPLGTHPSHPSRRNTGHPTQYESPGSQTDHNNHPQGDDSNYFPPPPSPRRGSSQSGIFFSGASHFGLNGGEFIYAGTVNKNVTSDHSHRSNYNNRRNDDYRGSTSYARNWNGAYNDNRQFRSQHARYNAQYSHYHDQEEGEGEYDEDGNERGHRSSPNYGRGRGDPRRGYGPSRRGGYPGPQERLPPRQRNTWNGPSEPERARPATNTLPMLELRQAVPQRERDNGNAFDIAYSEQSSSAGPEPEYEHSQYPNQSWNRNRAMMYQEEPLPDPDSGVGIASPIAWAANNPFRTASVPGPGPSASGRDGNSSYTPYYPSNSGTERSPPQERDAEVEGDVEMGDVEPENTGGGPEGGFTPDSGLGRPSRARPSSSWTN